MKNKRLHRVKLFSVVAIFIVLVGILCFNGFIINFCSKLFVNAKSLSGFSSIQTYQEETVSKNTNLSSLPDETTPSLTFKSFTSVDAGTLIPGNEYETNYTGSKQTISVSFTKDETRNCVVKWFYSKTVSDMNISYDADTNTYTYAEGVSILTEDENSENISVLKGTDSGYYCAFVRYETIIYATDCIQETLHVTVLPKKVTLNILAPDKYYDGTTNVDLDLSLDGVVSGDDVTVSAIGNTANANADNSKYVYVTNIVISGENVADYTVEQNLQPTFVNVLPKPTRLIWETKDNKLSYVYTGVDQASNVSAYYYNISNEKVKLAFSIFGTQTLSANNVYINQFKCTGSYNFTITRTDSELNYDLQDDDGDDCLSLLISRATPIITISNTTFTYTGSRQDASRCVAINNQEQTPSFTNNYFTTVEEGRNLQVVVKLLQSDNYFAKEETFTIDVLKATAEIDISKIATNYTYNGQEQVINSGAEINNQEQTLKYTNNTFTTVEQGNGLVVTVYALATDNYNYVEKSLTLSVDKQKINTSTWQWYYPSNQFTYSGQQKSVYVIYNNNAVSPRYKNNSFVNAGTYVASVDFVLDDPDNYYPVTFDSLIWQIKKADITKPFCEDLKTTYNGQLQVYPVNSSSFYTVKNNTATFAGKTDVYIKLKDTNNYQWADGTTSDIVASWEIERAKLAIPHLKDSYEFNGKEFVISSPDESLYTIYNNKGSEVGKYTSYIVLKDTNNYCWINGSDDVVVFDWEILPSGEVVRQRVFEAVLTILVAVFVILCVAFCFVIVSKRNRRMFVKNTAIDNGLFENKIETQVNLLADTLAENNAQEEAKMQEEMAEGQKEEPETTKEKVDGEQAVSEDVKETSTEHLNAENEDSSINKKTTSKTTKTKKTDLEQDAQLPVKTRKKKATSKKITAKKAVKAKKTLKTKSTKTTKRKPTPRRSVKKVAVNRAKKD